jgi:hypothetical protein
MKWNIDIISYQAGQQKGKKNADQDAEYISLLGVTFRHQFRQFWSVHLPMALLTPHSNVSNCRMVCGSAGRFIGLAVL